MAAYKVTKKYMVIKDIRHNKIFIDDCELIRNFEEIINDFDTVEEAIKKYPDAIVIVQKKG